MNTRVLGITVLASAILIFGGNLLAVSRGVSNSKSCDCSQLEDLVVDVSNAVYLRREFRSKIRELRELDEAKAHDEFKLFVDRLNTKIKSPKCYKGPANVEFVPWGRRQPVYSLSRFTDAQLCEPSETTKQQLKDAKSGACCEADAAAAEAHEKFHHDKCLGMGYKNYHEMGSADRAAEEAEAYNKQISVACTTLKTMSCPNAKPDVLKDLGKYCR